METARAYQRMVNEFGLTQEAIAQKVACDRSSVANMLRLTSLPLEVQQMIEADQLSAGMRKVILGLMTPAAQVSLATQIVSEQLSVRDAERLVQAMRKRRRQGSDPFGHPCDRISRSGCKTPGNQG